jgi:hypothetical protein
MTEQTGKGQPSTPTQVQTEFYTPYSLYSLEAIGRTPNDLSDSHPQTASPATGSQSIQRPPSVSEKIVVTADEFPLLFAQSYPQVHTSNDFQSPVTTMPQFMSRDGGDPSQIKKNKQSMADLKLRRLTELNNRLREDLERERIPVSQASKRYVRHLEARAWRLVCFPCI